MSIYISSEDLEKIDLEFDPIDYSYFEYIYIYIYISSEDLEKIDLEFDPIDYSNYEYIYI